VIGGFFMGFSAAKANLESSISLREFGKNAASDREKSTYKVSLSTIFA
jgi:hypothetical protein